MIDKIFNFLKKAWKVVLMILSGIIFVLLLIVFILYTIAKTKENKVIKDSEKEQANEENIFNNVINNFVNSPFNLARNKK